MRRSLVITIGLSVLLLPGAGRGESLWRSPAPSTAGGYLFTDVRASRVGDVVTVLVVESASSKVQGTTDAKRDGSANVDLTGANVFGFKLGQTLGAAGTRGLFSYNGTSAHKGTGTINRTEEVTAQVPARVMKVLDNGLLLIEGRRLTVVNNETTTLAFSGVVRPEDITPDNTVRSTQVADAEVSMLGKGIIQEKQNPGFFNRLLDIFRVF